MKAKFATKCKACGDNIRPGKEIAKDVNGIWVHQYCVEEKLSLP